MWKQAVVTTNITPEFSRRKRPLSQPRLKLNTSRIQIRSFNSYVNLLSNLLLTY